MQALHLGTAKMAIVQLHNAPYISVIHCTVRALYLRIIKMAVFETTKAAPLSSIATFRIVNLIDNALQSLRNWYTARATSTTLAKLSDAQLRDIGLDRGLINDVSRRLVAGRK